MMNTQAVVHIRKGEARSLKAGGMWIYDNEIERIEGCLLYTSPSPRDCS